ncbi:MAG TPA: tripartite tricarboxylate transporter permease [Candidatus Nanoarchaeia archaeon]|nr:tripartite tricarboxylate transporter permease [Candidatus Nanoarchaeia archaeon]
MLAEIIAALLIGILFGIITGLIPGIHINLIGAFLISLSTGFLLNINPLYLVVFITSMSLTHTFIDFIPSILLGCPDTSTELSVLPGHELLKKGQGFNAIVLSAYGSFFAIFLLLIISFPAIKIIPKIYPTIESFLPFLLIFISFLMIMLEKNRKTALFVFLISGILGFSILNLEGGLKQPLLPLLTGLFGSSMLITSIKNKPLIPKQKIPKKTTFSLLNRKNFSRAIIGSMFASPLCSFLPGLGSGQAAIIGNTLFNKKQNKENKKTFLVLLGATNTLVMGFSFITLYILSKTRTGSAAAIKTIIGSPNNSIILLIILIIFLSGVLSYYITIILGRFFCKKIHQIPYHIFSYVTLSLLALVILLVSGLFGLLVFSISSLTGFYLISLGVRRTNMMGCLLVPTILIYLGF